MIIFRGALNTECEKYVDSRLKKARLTSLIFLTLFGSIPIVITGLLLHPLFFIALIIGVPMVFAEVFLHDKSFKDRPEEIIVDDICVEIKSHYADRVIFFDKIGRLYDMGTWYKVQSNNYYHTLLVFQKDLIVEGTLEEFETIFQDKIVKS